MKRVAIFLSIFTSFLIALNNDKSNFKNLNFRFIGPDGNRAIAISGVSSDHNTYYVGAASGGLFKTTNKGISWKQSLLFPCSSFSNHRETQNTFF